MTIPIILAAMTAGYLQALYTGFLPLGSITARGEILATAFRIVMRWSLCFLIAILIGTPFLYFIGPSFFHRFIDLEYLLVLFLAIVNLLNLSAKHEHFRNFLYNKRWLYSLGMLQGFSALGNMVSVFSLTDNIFFSSVLMACLAYTLTYCITVSVFAIFIGLMANTQHRVRTALVVFLSILGIIIGILHFFLGII
jgi:hypothetical protein